MSATNLYITYKLINRLLYRAMKQEVGQKVTVRLNPLRFIFNRTNYFYWVEGIELVLVSIKKPITLRELNLLEELILFNINMILKCIEFESFREVKKIDFLIIYNISKKQT